MPQSIPFRELSEGSTFKLDVRTTSPEYIKVNDTTFERVFSETELSNGAYETPHVMTDTCRVVFA